MTISATPVVRGGLRGMMRTMSSSALRHARRSAVRLTLHEGDSITLRCPSRFFLMPLGGLVEPLPASLGRSNRKGGLSNVNLRRKRQQRAEVRRHKKKLLPPSASSSEGWKKQVKEELLALVKRNAIYAQRRPEDSPAVRTEPARGDAEPPAERGTQSEQADVQDNNNRAAAVRVALQVAAAAEDDLDQQPREVPRVPPRTALEEQLAVNISTATSAAIRAATTHSAVMELAAPRNHGDRAARLEQHFAVQPGNTVFGSDLDRLERDTLRTYHQRGSALPPLDKVFSAFGGGRRARRLAWEPSSSWAHMNPADFVRSQRSEAVVGDMQNKNVSAHYMSAEAYREQAARGTTRGCSRRTIDVGGPAPPAAESEDQPARANPHFPIEDVAHDEANDTRRVPREDSGGGGPPSETSDRMIYVDARADYKPRLHTVDRGAAEGDAEGTSRVIYDAYTQRPAEPWLVQVRGVDYWHNYDNRKRLHDHARQRELAFEREVMAEGAADTSEVNYSTNKVRKETLLYFQAHPINMMIQESFVRIRQILPRDGGEAIYIDPYNASAPVGGDPLGAAAAGDARSTTTTTVTTGTLDVDLPVQEARRLAHSLGLDLIRVGTVFTDVSDRRVVAVCIIADHREHLREMIRFKIQKLGVQPPPTKACVEVPFRGGTHPHAIRFKSIGIAKHLLHRHAVRINLTKFGTPREGFPVLQTILDEVKRQCLQLRAFHKAGEVQANYNEIYCYLYPSTGRSPKTTVDHPTPAQVRAAGNFSVLANEEDVYFNQLHDMRSPKERLQYQAELEKGTAWAYKDDGLSLRRQRAMKVMLGYLPKGNNELYAARGDVDIPAPFRSSHPTSTDRWTYPMESNLEQASRGAATLGKRASMAISEMHDRGETSENPTQLDRFYYKVQGSALEVGELKEALGLKSNRRKTPPLAPGFATLGKGSGRPPEPEGFATK